MSRWVPRIRRDVFCATLVCAIGTAGTASARDEYLGALVHQARVQKLAQSRTWQVLLHYRPMWYGWRSEADGVGFFNAGPLGKIDPQRELEATLVAFRAPGQRRRRRRARAVPISGALAFPETGAGHRHDEVRGSALPAFDAGARRSPPRR